VSCVERPLIRVFIDAFSKPQVPLIDFSLVSNAEQESVVRAKTHRVAVAIHFQFKQQFFASLTHDHDTSAVVANECKKVTASVLGDEKLGQVGFFFMPYNV